MENDPRPAAEFLRRMAPTQSHENRRNFLLAAQMLEGPDVKPRDSIIGPVGMSIYTLPVRYGDIHLGYFSVRFDAPDSQHDVPNIHVAYEKADNASETTESTPWQPLLQS